MLLTTTCWLTLCRRSVTGLTQVSPGPRSLSCALPHRNTTPCSYWRMTLYPNINCQLLIWCLAKVASRTGSVPAVGVGGSRRGGRGRPGEHRQVRRGDEEVLYALAGHDTGPVADECVEKVAVVGDLAAVRVADGSQLAGQPCCSRRAGRRHGRPQGGEATGDEGFRGGVRCVVVERQALRVGQDGFGVAADGGRLGADEAGRDGCPGRGVTGS